MTPPRELADLPYAEALSAYGGSWFEDDYDTVHVDGLTVTDVDVSGARFMECAVTRTTFECGGFRRVRFIDTWFHETRVVGTDLAESNWQDVTFLGGVLAGPQLYGAELTRVVFQGCKLDSLNLREARLSDVRFDDCVLADVDFGGATLRRVTFPGSRLTGVDFSRVTLEKVDLRGAELGLSGGAECLRGATISAAQLLDLAPVFATSLGITVK
jgi:uncharacterized protein YjbI with pentapeptide repeats